MADASLISAAKTSDSGLRVALHPLVLLTVSDYITRHSLAQQPQPIVGALLGQQRGREITLEVAYDLRLLPLAPAQAWRLDGPFFEQRLKMYEEVYKAPDPLSFVGWWTVSPAAGPGPEVLGIHRHVLQTYNEAALLLTFHPAAVRDGVTGGQLPLAIYETVFERAKREDAGPDAMQVEGAEADLELRFRKLAYEVASGEAEMIGVDTVARTAGRATDNDGAAPVSKPTLEEKGEEKPKDGKHKRGRPPKNKGKGKAEDEEEVEEEFEEAGDPQDLNAEEEELISFLGTRANAIRMLHTRISLLRSYLEQLPPSYLTDPNNATPPAPTSDGSDQTPAVSHPLLRSIQALTVRLPLLVPSDGNDAAGFAQAEHAERCDVALVELLGGLGQSAQKARVLGQRFGTVEAQRRERSKGGPHSMGNPSSGWAGDIMGDEMISNGGFASGSGWLT